VPEPDRSAFHLIPIEGIPDIGQIGFITGIRVSAHRKCQAIRQLKHTRVIGFREVWHIGNIAQIPSLGALSLEIGHELSHSVFSPRSIHNEKAFVPEARFVLPNEKEIETLTNVFETTAQYLR
jgi:hypothetical protein